jgi:hypothetical protein
MENWFPTRLIGNHYEHNVEEGTDEDVKPLLSVEQKVAVEARTWSGLAGCAIRYIFISNVDYSS